MSRVALLVALTLTACGGRVDIPSEDNDSGTANDTGIVPGSDTMPPAVDSGGCTPEQCGPATGAPAELCWDGSYGGVTGCQRLPDGRCGYGYRACPPPKPCTRSSDCGKDNLYCRVDIGLCGKGGTCALKPEACDLLYAPVCGCDGKTYPNACAADQAGVALSYKGECRTTTSGCPGGCPDGSFCKYADGACSGPGSCTKIPMGCPDLWSPVCGCDGKTYGNSCDASAVMQSIRYKGECK